MSGFRGKTHGHSHDKALLRAKALDGNPENFDEALESPLAEITRQVDYSEVTKFRKEQEEREISEAKLREPKVLMKDGKWLVEPEERPKGWEKLTLALPRQDAHNSLDSICTPVSGEPEL